MSDELKLFDGIRKFLCEYLPIQRNASLHTVRAYRTGLRQFLEYAARRRGCKLRDLTFDDISRETVVSFLDELESCGQCCVRTRNLRLNALRSFMTYCGTEEIETVGVWNRLNAIPFKKAADRGPVKFMSEKAMAAILGSPPANTVQGRRDRMMLTLLYDTGARVQELVDVGTADLNLTANPSVTLHGKGCKSRIVPLMNRTVSMLRRFLSELHDSPSSLCPKLFYAEGRRGRRRMTEDNIRVLVAKYGRAARMRCPEVPEHVHPHMFRHSRAMHLYSNGMDLTLVSQWLGHAQFETTLIYAHAGVEKKRAAIELATPENSPLKAHLKRSDKTTLDDDTIRLLYGLA